MVAGETPEAVNERARHQRQVKAVEALTEAVAAQDPVCIEAAILKAKDAGVAEEVYQPAREQVGRLKVQLQLRQAMLGARMDDVVY